MNLGDWESFLFETIRRGCENHVSPDCHRSVVKKLSWVRKVSHDLPWNGCQMELAAGSYPKSADLQNPRIELLGDVRLTRIGDAPDHRVMPFFLPTAKVTLDEAAVHNRAEITDYARRANDA